MFPTAVAFWVSVVLTVWFTLAGWVGVTAGSQVLLRNDAYIDTMEHTLTSIRDELCRFIWLNEAERWEETCNALEQLEHFGDELIPGLIECLSDGNPNVRHQAVRLLGAARPRSDVAVPDLIERLNDDDWLIVTSTMFHLGRSGHWLRRRSRRLSRGLNRQMNLSAFRLLQQS